MPATSNPMLTYDQWLKSALSNDTRQSVSRAQATGEYGYGVGSETQRNQTYKGAYDQYFNSAKAPGAGDYLDNPYSPGSVEHTIWQKLIEGEKKQEYRTGKLDKEIRGVYGQMLLDSGKPDQMALSDINRSERSGKAGAFQSLASRGLGNTTVVDAVQRQVGEGAQRERRGVYQDATKNKQGVQAMYANYLNSITNQGPDSSIYANLLTGTASQGGRKNNAAGDYTAILATMAPIVAALVS